MYEVPALVMGLALYVLVVLGAFGATSAFDSGYTEHVGMTGSGAHQQHPVNCSSVTTCMSKASAACTDDSKCLTFAFDPTCVGTDNAHCGLARLFTTAAMHSSKK